MNDLLWKRRRTPYWTVYLVVMVGVVLGLGGATRNRPSADLSDEQFWRATVEQLLPLEGQDSEQAVAVRVALSRRIDERLKQRSSFVEFLRDELRRDARPAVRCYIAYALLMGLREKVPVEDLAYMMGDEAVRVHDLAQLHIRRYEVKALAHTLPLLLLDTNAIERVFGVMGIQHFYGAMGFPYYARMVDDPDAEVAARAALALTQCSPHDARRHLARYFKSIAAGETQESIISDVLKGLEAAYEVKPEGETNIAASVVWWRRWLNAGDTGEK